MLYTGAKVGKTRLAASLNEITTKYRGKPTIFIACEAAEGGGTMTLEDLGIDYMTPKNWTEFEATLAWLTTDSTYGGVVLDNATDYVARIVKPHALAFPTKEIATQPLRAVGVPARSDYQTMGENGRGHMNRLINLTNESTDPKFRKDLIVTALERDKSNDAGQTISIYPDLPGALSGTVTAMFQSVVSIGIKQRVIKGEDGISRRLNGRQLLCSTDGVRVSGDRTKMYQDGYNLTQDDGKPIGLVPMYEAWLAGMKGAK
jgi:hypothetical protein